MTLSICLLLAFTFAGGMPALCSPQQEAPAHQETAAVANARIEAPDRHAPAAPSEYVLQRGDDIEIRVFNLPDLNIAMRIRPDGKISCVVLDDVQAAGLTTSQLTRVLNESYSRHFRNPRVSVIVKTFGSENVFVGGEVEKPGAVPLRGDLTAVQAVMRAGGFKDSGAPEKVAVLRAAAGGKQEVTTLNVTEILENRRADLPLRPSDVVYVPKAYVNVYVGGEVTRPGLVPLAGDMTIMSAIIAAGGFRETAKTDGVVLIRKGENGSPLASTFKLNDVFESSAHTRLQPFDVVFVPKSRVARVNKWIDQYIRQMSPAILSIGFSYILNPQGGGILRIF